MNTHRDGLRAIAYYLPQFHPTAENDRWWGKGFTEWRGVARARPMFTGHLQPHEPSDLGFYDLRVPETRQEQADMAQRYGIHGFCYYHYWFSGDRLLRRPLEEVLESGQPDFPFCIAWANEPWVRSWLGRPGEVLMPQRYEHGWADDFFRDMLPIISDKRYIKVAGKPLLLVSRAYQIPDVLSVTEHWRALALSHGLNGLYLVAVQSKDIVNPTVCGFDAAVQMPPFGAMVRRVKNDSLPSVNSAFRGRVASYAELADACLRREESSYTWFRGVAPGWDNSPRRSTEATVFLDSTPEGYEAWLEGACDWTLEHRKGDERIVFINAWNEWAEGAHLEPDLRHGHGYLEATGRVLSRLAAEGAERP